MASKKMVYFFGNGKSEGAKETKALLGGKGLGLAQMTESKVPVPAGFHGKLLPALKDNLQALFFRGQRVRLLLCFLYFR